MKKIWNKLKSLFLKKEKVEIETKKVTKTKRATSTKKEQLTKAAPRKPRTTKIYVK